jgi:hypothetical protein
MLDSDGCVFGYANCHARYSSVVIPSSQFHKSLLKALFVLRLCELQCSFPVSNLFGLLSKLAHIVSPLLSCQHEISLDIASKHIPYVARKALSSMVFDLKLDRSLSVMLENEGSGEARVGSSHLTGPAPVDEGVERQSVATSSLTPVASVLLGVVTACAATLVVQCLTNLCVSLKPGVSPEADLIQRLALEEARLGELVSCEIHFCRTFLRLV